MPVSYTSTYDPDTLIGQVRLTTFDVDVTSVPPAVSNARSDWSCLFTDQELMVFIGRYPTNSNQVNLASADALDAIASNAALLSKRIRLGDYEQDTTKTARDLRDQATRLRTQGEETPAESFGDVAYTDANYRRMVVADAMNRGG